MNELTSVQIDKASSEKLGELARINRRSKTAQISSMIDAEYQRLWQVVSMDTLPHPPDGEAVTRLTIAKKEASNG